MAEHKCGTCRYLEYDKNTNQFVCGNYDCFNYYAQPVEEDNDLCGDWEEED